MTAAGRSSAAPVPTRPKRKDVSGWVILDKHVGMTSTHAVAVVKRAFNAKKAGHAGTLDPLASGILPIALVKWATKTVPFVMDGRKAYRFTVSWGVETDTDDARAVPLRRARPGPSAQPSRRRCQPSLAPSSRSRRATRRSRSRASAPTTSP